MIQNTLGVLRLSTAESSEKRGRQGNETDKANRSTGTRRLVARRQVPRDGAEVGVADFNKVGTDPAW
jgi:hypothetical protein